MGSIPTTGIYTWGPRGVSGASFVVGKLLYLSGELFRFGGIVYEPGSVHYGDQARVIVTRAIN